MKLREACRATCNWAPSVGRTIGYGTISLALGPLTKDHGASLWAMRAWCKATTRGLNIEVVASGVENVPPRGAFVYCSNHQSLVDVLVLGSVLPGDYKWAAKRSLMKIPFIGWHLRLAGHVPVDRGAGPGAAGDAVARFQQVLARGKPLLVFPEGTRSEDGIVRDFELGGFCAAARQGVPVVPIAVEGTHRLMRKAPSTSATARCARSRSRSALRSFRAPTRARRPGSSTFARAHGRRSSSCIARSAATSPRSLISDASTHGGPTG